MEYFIKIVLILKRGLEFEGNLKILELVLELRCIIESENYENLDFMKIVIKFLF